MSGARRISVWQAQPSDRATMKIAQCHHSCTRYVTPAFHNATPDQFGQTSSRSRAHAKKMDSYVVYIYRRPDRDGGTLAGLIERVGSGERKAFQSETQLLQYLAAEQSSSSQNAPRRNASNKRSKR